MRYSTLCAGLLLLFWGGYVGCQGRTPGANRANEPSSTRGEAIADSTIFFPQIPEDSDQEYPDALLRGELVLKDGCLRVHSAGEEGESYWIVWPPHISLVESAPQATVIDHQSGALARVGMLVELGGGKTTSSAPALEEIPSHIWEKCQGPLWLTSSIVNAQDP